MNNLDIEKALESCLNLRKSCTECPFGKYSSSCNGRLLNGSLTYIKHLKEEVRILNDTIINLKNKIKL